MFGNDRNTNEQYPNMFGNGKTFEQQLQTNKWRVQSLQDALTRYAPPNSCGCYYCTIDGEDYEYEIYTDYNGTKSYKVYKRLPCESSTDNVDLKMLLNKINELEAKINAKSPTDSTNAKSAADSTNGI